MSDLVGFSVYGDYGYSAMQPQSFPADADDFGFDPLPGKSTYPVKIEQTCSPPDDNDTYGDFGFDPVKEENARSPNRPPELDRMVAWGISNAKAVISPYGQVTPPRSNSESSIEASVEQKPTRKRRSTKSSLKEEPIQPVPAPQKRRNTRKNSTVTTGYLEEDEKRKYSLEKNRLSASKRCNNGRERMAQLQSPPHDNAVQNALLKKQIMRMKEEVKQINALRVHANSEGWKSPEDIQNLHSNIGNNSFAQDTQGLAYNSPAFTNMSLDHSDVEHDHYFSPTIDPIMM